MKINRILFPTDFSDRSQARLATAAAVAKANDAELMLLHVDPPQPEIAGPIAAYPPGVPDTRDLEAALTEIDPGEQVGCSHHVLPGTPAKVICDFAREHDVDLIVLSTHGRTGMTRLLMGSVAEAVVRQAPCAVLTFKDASAETANSTNAAHEPASTGEAG